MSRRKIVFGVGAGVLSVGVDSVTGLLLLRLLLEFLPVELAGYWVLVTSAGSFLILLQCGLGPTIARTLAQDRVTSDPTTMRSMVGAVHRCFRYIAGAVAMTAILVFLAYLWPTAQQAHVPLGTALSWFLYTIAMIANLQGQASLFIMNGYGEVGWDKVFRALFAAAGFGFVWLALKLGAQLPVLGVIYLVQNLCFWGAAHIKLKSFLGGAAVPLPPKTGQVRRLFADGSKLLLLSVLTYAITQLTIFFVERYFGLSEVPKYSALLRVGVLIGTIGGLVPQMLYPFVANAWASGNVSSCRRYYLLGIVATVALALVMSLPIYFVGHRVFDLWLGQGSYPGNSCLAAVLIFYFVVVHHSAHATPALAICGNAFMTAAIVNTVLVFVLLFWLPKVWGLVGVPWAMTFGTLPSSVYVIWFSWRLIMRSQTIPKRRFLAQL